MYAAQAGNLDAVTFLISKGSNTEQQRKVLKYLSKTSEEDVTYAHTGS